MTELSTSNGHENIDLPLKESGYPLVLKVIEGCLPRNTSRKLIEETLTRIKRKYRQENNEDLELGFEEREKPRGKSSERAGGHLARTVTTASALRYIVQYLRVQQQKKEWIQALECQIQDVREPSLQVSMYINPLCDHYK